ncbi:MAG: hypothetical protein CFE37_10265 [Alphaproteobacteria bacterium PA4]|nr:MAG: hypothetical protein CFE37_10265 [Alphaproteobacteria bacterium PA4]
MQVLVLVKATEESETEAMPLDWTEAMMAAMGRFNDELRAAGVLLMAAGLEPSAGARRVRFDGSARAVSTGPFLPAEDLVAGFWLWEVKDLDEATAWVQRCPNPMPGPSVIEIRPIAGT